MRVDGLGNFFQGERFGVGGKEIASAMAALGVHNARLFQLGHDLAYQHGVCADVLRKLLTAEHLFHVVEINQRMDGNTE